MSDFNKPIHTTGYRLALSFERLVGGLLLLASVVFLAGVVILFLYGILAVASLGNGSANFDRIFSIEFLIASSKIWSPGVAIAIYLFFAGFAIVNKWKYRYWLAGVGLGVLAMWGLANVFLGGNILFTVWTIPFLIIELSRRVTKGYRSKEAYASKSKSYGKGNTEAPRLWRFNSALNRYNSVWLFLAGVLMIFMSWFYGKYFPVGGFSAQKFVAIGIALIVISQLQLRYFTGERYYKLVAYFYRNVWTSVFLSLVIIVPVFFVTNGLPLYIRVLAVLTIAIWEVYFYQKSRRYAKDMDSKKLKDN